MDAIAALVRVFGYLFVAVMMMQTAMLAKRLRGALLATAALLAAQGGNALLVFLSEHHLRDMALTYIATPLIMLAAWMWIRAFWQVGTNGH